MSDWPMQFFLRSAVHQERTEDRVDPETGLNVPVSVIPADLGRELYEAADAYFTAGTPSELEPRLLAALTRYEREVGE